jgi:NADPH:quinone reductase-like Zn-dependent oxidoreductase
VLRDYDLVLHSLGNDELRKSLSVLKPGGHLVSISGPPTPDFAGKQGLAWPLKQVLRLLSYGIRKKSKQHGVTYTFLFMRPDGDQLKKITSLLESEVIRPIVDRVFPLDLASDALAYVETGRSKGKVIIKVK